MESSRFGSSGNLSQTSSQLSETGRESTGGSEVEESFHSYHSIGLHPSTNGQLRTNGHFPTNGHPIGSEKEIHMQSSEVGSILKNDTSEKESAKLQRYYFYADSNFACSTMLVKEKSYCLCFCKYFLTDSMMEDHHYHFPHQEFVG